jgi:hypothetical protein
MLLQRVSQQNQLLGEQLLVDKQLSDAEHRGHTQAAEFEGRKAAILERFKVKEQINKALEEGLGKKIQL